MYLTTKKKKIIKYKGQCCTKRRVNIENCISVYIFKKKEEEDFYTYICNVYDMRLYVCIKSYWLYY